MKSKTPIFIFALFFTLFVSKGFAQTGTPKGKAHLVEFTNETAKFKVPEGKTWYIYNVFCERKYNKGAEVESTRILISSINNIKFKNGPSIFNQNVGQNLNAPLIFPEKTTFELEISDPSGIKAVINYIEVDN